MKTDKKKQKIYDIYRENLNILIDNGFYKGLKDVYLCPICLEPKSLEELTLEDYPPKSVGGKANLLTCQKCNNEAGHKIDNHLGMKLTELQGCDKKVSVDINGVKVNGLYNKQKGYINYLSKNNNPHTFDDTMKSIKKGDNITLKTTEKISSIPSIKLAFLKTAYLFAFEKFGYTLMLDKNYDIIRNSIRENNTEYFNDKSIFCDTPYDEKNKLHKITGAYLITNKGYECIFVGFPIEKNCRKYYCCVLLSLPNRIYIDTNKFNELVGIKFYPQEQNNTFLQNKDSIIEMIKFYNIDLLSRA